MTIIFPGMQGMTLAMNDQRIIGLGQKQHQGLREQLLAESGKFKRSALIYSCGRWMVGEIPELDDRGDVLRAGTRVTQAIRQVVQPPSTAKLEDFSLDPAIDRQNLTVNDSESDSELDRMRAIYDYAKKKGAITKRSLQQATLATMKGLKADDIQFYLEYMQMENFLIQDEDIFYYNPNRSP